MAAVAESGCRASDGGGVRGVRAWSLVTREALLCVVLASVGALKGDAVAQATASWGVPTLLAVLWTLLGLHAGGASAPSALWSATLVAGYALLLAQLGEDLALAEARAHECAGGGGGAVCGGYQVAAGRARASWTVVSRLFWAQLPLAMRWVQLRPAPPRDALAYTTQLVLAALQAHLFVAAQALAPQAVLFWVTACTAPGICALLEAYEPSPSGRPQP